MRKHTLEKLFSSEIMNAIDALIVVMNTHGQIVFLNTACEKLTGYSLSEVQNRAVWDVFILPEESEATKAAFSALVTFARNNSNTNYWLTKSGEKKLISWSNVRLLNKKEQLEYIIATGADITEKEKDKHALLEREAKYKSIVKTAPDSIIIINDKGTIEEVNPAVQKVFGYKEEELIGKNVNILMPEPFHGEHGKYISHYIATGEKNIIGAGREVTALSKEGIEIPVHLNVSEAWSNDATLFTGILRDLRQEKIQEEKLRRIHKIEAIGQLTGGIAHDFNNLLTVILGNLEMLDRELLGSEGNERLDEVFEVIEQGTQLVTQLLAFGKRQSLNPKILDLNDIVRQLTRLLLHTLREDLEIENRLQHDLWKIHADPVQIENALLNIILNAKDAMPEGGKIIIKTANRAFTKKKPPSNMQINPGNYVELSIIDQGSGMNNETLRRIFDPFFTTKEVGMGTGLGLSMVHGFIEQSSGGIFVESKEGEGTKVSLYLPQSYHKTKIRKTTKDNPYLSHDGAGNKILHVEDDTKVRQVNTQRLISLGYDVLTAKDAPTALKVLSEHKDVQLVFSDIVMPGGMNGIELANEIKKRHPAVRILLTTGYAKGTLTDDASDYTILRKPFTHDQLATKLQEISNEYFS